MTGKFFRPLNFFKLFEQFQKLVAFLLPIFRNVDGSWRVTSKLRGSTLIQVARRRSKVFQRFSASLVRVEDVQGVSRRHAVRGKKNAIWLLGLKQYEGQKAQDPPKTWKRGAISQRSNVPNLVHSRPRNFKNTEVPFKLKFIPSNICSCVHQHETSRLRHHTCPKTKNFTVNRQRSAFQTVRRIFIVFYSISQCFFRVSIVLIPQKTQVSRGVRMYHFRYID